MAERQKDRASLAVSHVHQRRLKNCCKEHCRALTRGDWDKWPFMHKTDTNKHVSSRRLYGTRGSPDRPYTEADRASPRTAKRKRHGRLCFDVRLCVICVCVCVNGLRGIQYIAYREGG